MVGFDFDQNAVEAAFQRAGARDLAFLPLCLDLSNPSPNQGWDERERKGLRERQAADGLLALALVHHLAIGRNVPIERVVAWLLEFAPMGTIEFVPKSDPMVQKMLQFRDDIFDGYTEENFAARFSPVPGSSGKKPLLKASVSCFSSIGPDSLDRPGAL